jgi:uncharacterized membrane protein
MKRLFIFRGLVLALLVFLAFKPSVVRPEKSDATRWAGLIDTSASMRVADSTVRLAGVQRSVASDARKLDDVDFFQFSDHASPVSIKDIGALKPLGKKSDISAALRDTLGRRPFRGALVFTDGRDVGQEDAVTAAAALGKPLFLVGVGNRTLFRDVSVRSVQAPPFAFKNVVAPLTATVAALGFANQEMTVSLKEGARVLSSQRVVAPSSDAEIPVNFSWTPGSIGSRHLSVVVDALPGEATSLNNKKDIVLDVGRDRFRVLYICGVPGPEYGFLRYQFKSDPAVELVTFVILRNTSNTMNIAESELSLIPFPSQDVLINQVKSFDLVVFEEFNYAQYGLLPSLVSAIRQKVLEGGAFLLMGGPIAFGEGSSYAIPTLSDMLPVQIGTPQIRTLKEPAKLILKTPSHPIVRLDENAERNQAVWRGLPALDDVTLLGDPKPGAQVLATVQNGGKESPVLAAWRFGKGRVAVLSARTTWRWSMLMGEKERRADVYQRFWKNMVLWLTRSDEFKPVRVAIDGGVAHVGEPLRLRVWVYDDYFQPLSDADVHLSVSWSDGKSEPVTLHPETTGVFAADVTPSQLGHFAVTAIAARRGKRVGEDKLNAEITENLSEEEDLRPDFDLLKEMAQATGGVFMPLEQFTPALWKEFSGRANVGIGRKILLWNSPWLLMIVLILLGVEWWVRKRRGLP